MIAGPPEEQADHVTVPAAVRAVADGRTIRPVWVNVLGGVTFEVGARGERDRRFVKWAPADSRLDLAGEAARMSWAGAYTAVPTVLRSGTDDDGTWLATTPMPGDSAVSERWRHDPATAVDAIGAGLRALHDALPVADCPFAWTPAVRLDRAAAHDGGRDHVSTHDDDDTDAHAAVSTSWHDAAHQGLAVRQARRILADPPPVDRLVVCHGDACAPNTLIDEGRWSAHVDLGALGAADRWADIAIATWSTQWNYGPGWEQALLDAYGVDPDPLRTAWYRLLWDMT